MYLWNIDSRPKQLKMLSHLRGLVLGVENGQLGEHAHVCPLQAQGSLHESDQLLKVPSVLVVVDQVLQFVGVDHNVQAAHLRQPKLLCIHT